LRAKLSAWSLVNASRPVPKVSAAAAWSCPKLTPARSAAVINAATWGFRGLLELAMGGMKPARARTEAAPSSSLVPAGGRGGGFAVVALGLEGTGLGDGGRGGCAEVAVVAVAALMISAWSKP
jgi:hypothetical protein